MARKDFDPDTVKPDGRSPAKGTLFDPETDGPWRGSLPGDLLGSGTTVLAYGMTRRGKDRAFTFIPMMRPSS